MVLDFRFNMLRCHYYVEDEKIDGVCFAKGYKKITRDNKVYCSLIWKKRKDGANYCFMKERDLLAYFIKLSKLLGFKIISFSSNRKLYDLQFVCPANERLFLYITTCMRYVYEFPFAFLTMCAWKNRKQFGTMDILHIIHFYLGLFFCTNNHSAGRNGIFYPQRDCKCEYNYMMRNSFNTGNYSCQFFVEDYIPAGQRWLKVLNSKQYSKIEKIINKHAKKVYEKVKKDIYRWRSK